MPDILNLNILNIHHQKNTIMRQFLNGVQGVDIYLIVSLLIFFIFFVGMLIWLVRVNKTYIQEAKNIPFNDEPQKLQKS
jgi:cbb3-type cytochrome oxidase subunit 3